MYTIQIKRGVYLTDKLTKTEDLQACIIIDDYRTAELYLEGKYDKVIEIKFNNIIELEEEL